MAGRGAKKKIRPEHHAVLREIVAERPHASIPEIKTAFARRTGIDVYRDTLSRGLEEAGIKRIRDPRSVSDKAAEASATRATYGYRAMHRACAPEQRYASSLTDAEWALVSDLFEIEGSPGKPPRYARRALLDACCYVVRTGCSWRMLPGDFPPWQNVYATFRRWARQGKFEVMHDRLRGQWRARLDRRDTPTAAVVDAQSTRISPQGGDSGFDAGKKVKGRKRHLVVDTLGLLLAVSVTAASVQDRAGAHPVMASAVSKYPTLETVFADSGYAGQCAQTLSQQHDIEVEIVRHARNAAVGRWVSSDQQDLFELPAVGKKPFVTLPWRWVVERTHAWVEKSRRLVMHHDRRTDVAEAWVWLTQARMLAARVTRSII